MDGSTFFVVFFVRAHIETFSNNEKNKEKIGFYGFKSYS